MRSSEEEPMIIALTHQDANCERLVSIPGIGLPERQ
jgi:hypothetical protein